MPPLKSHRCKSNIRRSTDADLVAIHAWLKDQDEHGVPGTFLCNWTLTEKCHQKGELLVYVDEKSGVPVAYEWGGLIQNGILEVRNDRRGMGIGTKLVERRIAEARKLDQSTILYIECTPSTSVPFWKRMGFTILSDSDDQRTFAYRVLDKKHPLPSDADPVHVSIRFYPERRKWETNVAPLLAVTPAAVHTLDNVIFLGERIACFDRMCPGIKDLVVEIEIANHVQYCDKARYPAALGFGVKNCTNGFYIDYVCL